MLKKEGLEHNIHKFSTFLNVILIISIIWCGILTIFNGIALFLPGDYLLFGIGLESGFISSALTLIVLIQLRVMIRESGQLTPFSQVAQKALEMIGYLALAKFFYFLIFPMLLGDGIDFNFSYLIISGICFTLVNVFKFANVSSANFEIPTQILKWMDIGLVIGQVFGIIVMILIVVGMVLTNVVFQSPEMMVDPILNEAIIGFQSLLPGVKSSLTPQDLSMAVLPFTVLILVTTFSFVYTIIQVRKIVKVLGEGTPFHANIVGSIQKISIVCLMTGSFQLLSSFLMMNLIFDHPLLSLISSLTFSPFVFGGLMWLLAYLFEYGQYLKGLTR